MKFDSGHDEDEVEGVIENCSALWRLISWRSGGVLDDMRGSRRHA
jgi:hypothetical protein